MKILFRGGRHDGLVKETDDPVHLYADPDDAAVWEAWMQDPNRDADNPPDFPSFYVATDEVAPDGSAIYDWRQR